MTIGNIKTIQSIMAQMTALLETNCPNLTLIARGKVRDIYAIPGHPEVLLFVATDRISAFDVVMKSGIPGKGKILTQMSLFWFELLHDIAPSHVITSDLNQMPAVVLEHADQLKGRSMLVRRLSIYPVEAIVRGFITGSAWEEYKKNGTVCTIPIPEGMKESEAFSEPIFTPSTKAELGGHDENIHPDRMNAIIGEDQGRALTRLSLRAYQKAREYAAGRGIIIADTKFEFGHDTSGSIVLADEVLTPDSSRFWPADKYAVGRGQDSFDKQYLRDYLKGVQFDRKTGVELPQNVLDNTLAKYVEAFTLLTGKAPVL